MEEEEEEEERERGFPASKGRGGEEDGWMGRCGVCFASLCQL